MIYDGNFNGDVLQNKIIVDGKKRERIISSPWTRDEMKSVFKNDFNTDNKIVLAVLKHFRGHKTSLKYQIRYIYNWPRLFWVLKFISVKYISSIKPYSLTQRLYLPARKRNSPGYIFTRHCLSQLPCCIYFEISM